MAVHYLYLSNLVLTKDSGKIKIYTQLLKYQYLEELLLVDIGELDPDDELPYTQENAELLMKNGTSFDTWVTETVGELENFTQRK